MMTSVKQQTTSMVEMSGDMRKDVIKDLKQMVEELEDPTRTFLDTRFEHKRDDEPGYMLTIKLNNLTEHGHTAVYEQKYLNNMAEVIEHQAKRIRESLATPLFIECTHTRPVKFMGKTPCHDGNEEFNFRLIFERPPGMAIGVEKTPVSIENVAKKGSDE